MNIKEYLNKELARLTDEYKKSDNIFIQAFISGQICTVQEKLGNKKAVNQLMSTWGKLAKGKRKKFSEAELKKRTERLLANRHQKKASTEI
jgi:hypothetical protein